MNVAPEPLHAPPKGSVQLPEAKEVKKDVKDTAKKAGKEAEKKGKEIEKKGKQYADKAKVCTGINRLLRGTFAEPGLTLSRRSYTRPSLNSPHTGKRQKTLSSDLVLSVVSWVLVSFGCINQYDPKASNEV